MNMPQPQKIKLEENDWKKINDIISTSTKGNTDFAVKTAIIGGIITLLINMCTFIISCDTTNRVVNQSKESNRIALDSKDIAENALKTSNTALDRQNASSVYPTVKIIESEHSIGFDSKANDDNTELVSYITFYVSNPTEIPIKNVFFKVNFYSDVDSLDTSYDKGYYSEPIEELSNGKKCLIKSYKSIPIKDDSTTEDLPILRKTFERYISLPYLKDVIDSKLKEAIKKDINDEIVKIDYGNASFSEAVLMEMNAYYKNTFNDCYCCTKVYQIIIETNKTIKFNKPADLNNLNIYLKFISDKSTIEISIEDYNKELKTLYNSFELDPAAVERNIKKW